MTFKLCRSCLMPNTRPRIVFDETGECNACENAKQQQEINWDDRKKEFLEVIDEYRADGPYDCVVPFSGGKDSAAIAWRLKHEYGLRPLLACYGQLMWTEVGRANFERVRRDGFDIVKWEVDGRVSRKLARRFFIERGCPKIHYNAGVNAVPLRTAIAFNIPLVIYAEHGESAFGGKVLDEESKRTRNLTEVLEHQIGDDPRNWAIDGISENELVPYIYPEADDIDRVGVEAFYFSYFHRWDIYENAKLVRDKMGFGQAQNWQMRPQEHPPSVRGAIPDHAFDGDGSQSNPLFLWWGKSDGSFEGFDSIDDKIDCLDFFMCHPKFLFGRATRMASRLIQGGHMTRENGLKLVRKYDGEFPRMYLASILEYLDMDLAELKAVIDQHRNPELWEMKEGEWQLKHHPA